jgi:hypothetical protein
MQHDPEATPGHFVHFQPSDRLPHVGGDDFSDTLGLMKGFSVTPVFFHDSRAMVVGLKQKKDFK